MLELRLTPEPKRIAAMRAAVAQECARSNAGAAHAYAVAFLAETLVAGEPGTLLTRVARRSEVLVIVTVQSDATMLMVRDRRPYGADLDGYRHRLLDEHTVRWSTMSGADGRTIWAEILRAPAPVAHEVTVEVEVEPEDRRSRISVEPAFASGD